MLQIGAFEFTSTLQFNSSLGTCLASLLPVDVNCVANVMKRILICIIKANRRYHHQPQRTKQELHQFCGVDKKKEEKFLKNNLLAEEESWFSGHEKSSVVFVYCYLAWLLCFGKGFWSQWWLPSGARNHNSKTTLRLMGVYWTCIDSLLRKKIQSLLFAPPQPSTVVSKQAMTLPTRAQTAKECTFQHKKT